MTYGLDDYDVYAQYVEEDVTHAECIGSVELPVSAGADAMPPELEINGYIYVREDVCRNANPTKG